MPLNAIWGKVMMTSPGLYAAVLDHSGSVLYVNQELSKLYGLSPDMIIGKPAVNLILNPNHIQEIMMMLEAATPHSKVMEFEEHISIAQDEDRAIAFVALVYKDMDTGTNAVILIGFDVTARSRITEALRCSEAQVRAIVETAVDAIITINDQGVIESFNPAAERIFGYNVAEVIGQKVEMLMPEPYHSEHQQYIDNYVHTGHAKIIGSGREVVGRRKDGGIFPMYLTVGEQKSSGGRHFTGIVRDLTERKQMEAEILQVVEREQQRIGQDLHDGLGQLLTGAAMISKAIAQRLQTKSKPLAREAEELTKFINEGIVQSRQLARGLQPLDDPDEFPNALEELGIRITKLPGIEECHIQIDPLPASCTLLMATHLYRIAQEAVNNAVRHSRAKHIDVRSITTGRAVKLMIRDDGIGISRQHHNGLGLRIMDYRSRVIGGQLKIQSNKDAGTTIICLAGEIEPSLEKHRHG